MTLHIVLISFSVEEKINMLKKMKLKEKVTKKLKFLLIITKPNAML